MIKVFDDREAALAWILEQDKDPDNFRIRYVDDDNWGVKGWIVIEDM